MPVGSITRARVLNVATTRQGSNLTMFPPSAEDSAHEQILMAFFHPHRSIVTTPHRPSICTLGLTSAHRSPCQSPLEPRNPSDSPRGTGTAPVRVSQEKRACGIHKTRSLSRKICLSDRRYGLDEIICTHSVSPRNTRQQGPRIIEPFGP